MALLEWNLRVRRRRSREILFEWNLELLLSEEQLAWWREEQFRRREEAWRRERAEQKKAGRKRLGSCA